MNQIRVAFDFLMSKTTAAANVDTKFYVSDPVVNNLSALVRLSMAVSESSYWRALLAYLQNFIAFCMSPGFKAADSEKEQIWTLETLLTNL